MLDLINCNIYNAWCKESEVNDFYNNTGIKGNSYILDTNMGFKILYYASGGISCQPLSQQNSNIWTPIIKKHYDLIDILQPTVSFDFVQFRIDLMCENYNFLIKELENFWEYKFSLDQLAKICNCWKGLEDIQIIENEFMRLKMEQK